jgi:hypothetical protein
VPALPWKTISTVDPDTEYTVMASRLPLRHYRHIPGFMRWTLRIRRQLARSSGLVGYSLDAHLLRKTFWTLSAWTARPELARFDGADPHRTATRTIAPRMLPTTFVTWTCRAADLPISWNEARRRIEAARTNAPTTTIA